MKKLLWFSLQLPIMIAWKMLVWSLIFRQTLRWDRYYSIILAHAWCRNTLFLKLEWYAMMMCRRSTQWLHESRYGFSSLGICDWLRLSQRSVRHILHFRKHKVTEDLILLFTDEKFMLWLIIEVWPQTNHRNCYISCYWTSGRHYSHDLAMCCRCYMSMLYRLNNLRGC